MRIDVITIFPEYLNPLGESLLGKARQDGRVEVGVHDLRTWTDDVHRTVDDTPYGGGPGMVMRPEPWGRALDAVCGAGEGTPRLIVPSPAGKPFTQALAVEYAQQPWLVFACGRYEGIDYRVVQDARTRMPVDEVSLGDYVLSGGEVAVLVIAEAVTRLLPGFVGNARSVVEDSFGDGLLEGPAYTRPETWRGLVVPDILRSGNHAAIARWRREQSLRRTARRRPDLLTDDLVAGLDPSEAAVLAEAGFPPEHPGVAQ